MEVWMGNAAAVEAFIDTDGQQKWRHHPGEFIFHAKYDEDLGPDHPDEPWTPATAASSIIGMMSFHYQLGTTPPWIESDNETLKLILCAHFGLDPKKSKRPKTWGDGSYLEGKRS